MIIYNENKELILKDNFREFHLVNSGFQIAKWMDKSFFRYVIKPRTDPAK